MDETIMLEAYRLIRIKAREFNGSSDEILGAYTRGVVDLQTELYKKESYKTFLVEDDGNEKEIL